MTERMKIGQLVCVWRRGSLSSFHLGREAIAQGTVAKVTKTGQFTVETSLKNYPEIRFALSGIEMGYGDGWASGFKIISEQEYKRILPEVRARIKEHNINQRAKKIIQVLGNFEAKSRYREKLLKEAKALVKIYGELET